MTTQGPISEEFIDTSWKDFEKNYDFEKKFGLDALKQKLDAERQGRGLDRVNSQYVLDSLGQLNMSGLQSDIDNHLTDKLVQAHEFRHPEMSPRAKQKPEQVNEDKVENVAEQKARQLPPWPGADKIDFAGNPNVRQAVENFVNQVNDKPAEFTTAYNSLKDALKNELKQQYKMRMAMRATPTRKPEAPRAG